MTCELNLVTLQCVTVKEYFISYVFRVSHFADGLLLGLVSQTPAH